jgi:hypothetical protein
MLPVMIPPDEEQQVREAIRRARELQRAVYQQTEKFPPEGRVLRDKIRAAADRTVKNLELAVDALQRERGAVN